MHAFWSSHFPIYPFCSSEWSNFRVFVLSFRYEAIDLLFRCGNLLNFKWWAHLVIIYFLVFIFQCAYIYIFVRDIGETKEGMKKGGRSMEERMKIKNWKLKTILYCFHFQKISQRFPYIISSMGDPQFLSSHPGAESYFRFSCSKESRISFSNVTVQLKALAIIWYRFCPILEFNIWKAFYQPEMASGLP